MPSLDDALKSIHDIILNRFGAGQQTPTGVSVVFEFGTPIPLAAIQGPSDPPTLSPARALELMSGLSNVVPDLRNTFFERGLRTVDGQYELLLQGAQPVDGSQIDVFSRIKAEALGKFGEVLQSVEGLHRFHPVSPMPINWYDPAVNENWSHFHVASENQSTSQPTNLILDSRLHQFRVVPAELRPMSAATSIQSVLHRLSFNTEPSHPEPRLTNNQNFPEDVIEVSNHQPVIVEFWASWCGPCRALTPRLQTALRAAKSAIQWIRIDVDMELLRPRPPVTSFVTTNGLPTLVVFMNGREGERIVGSVSDAQLQSFIQAIDESFIPTGTNRLVIDFDMCIVLLNRTWLSDGFLNLKNWFAQGVRKGEFSDGAAVPDPGALNTIPIASVLVRDLNVTAQWTTADISALQNAVNLGPFSLHGHDFDRHSGTLTVKGMQSIAWVCAKMPLLPPESDPALPTQ